jgi:hypothetical protein
MFRSHGVAESEIIEPNAANIMITQTERIWWLHTGRNISEPRRTTSWGKMRHLQAPSSTQAARPALRPPPAPPQCLRQVQ